MLDETENLSSQLVGRVGEQVTLLCLADEQIQNVSWTRGTRVTPNITFPHLHPTNAGVYMCSGATEQNGLVSHSVNLVISREFHVNFLM